MEQVSVLDKNTELQNDGKSENNVEISEELANEDEFASEDKLASEEESTGEEYAESRVSAVLRRVLNKKVIAVVVAVIVLLQAVTGAVLSGVVLNADKFAVSEKADSVFKGDLSEKSLVEWFKSKATDKYTENSEKRKLHAFELKNYDTSHSYVIMCHPMTATAEDMAVYAYHFYDFGFNVILPEAGGYGESEYKKINMGWFDRYDVALWAQKIADEDEKANIFLFGAGMGGSTVLMASSLDLPANVKGIISDSGYSDVKKAFKENIKDVYGLPSFPIVNFASLYVKIFEGWSFGEADALEQVKNSKVPVLIIHGGEDEVVPVSQSNDLFEASPVKKSDHLLISGATHLQTLKTNPEKYWMNVDSFILNNIENTP